MLKSILSACVISVGLALPALGREIKIGLQDDIDVLDPAQSRAFVSRIVYASLCDKLVDISPDLKLMPKLALDWHYDEDGKVLTMNLRQGVVFHDGTGFNADAVVYNIKRAMTMPQSIRKSELSSVENVEALGPYTVKITLKKRDSAFIAQLADYSGMMVSPTAAEKLGADLARAPVCAGPFKFVERVAQDRIVLAKFDRYWDAANIHFDKVTYLPIPDAAVRFANLRSGDLDMIERIAPTDYQTAKNDSKLQTSTVVSLGWFGLYFNVGNGSRADNPVGKEKLLRQAFSLAIDREVLRDVVYEGVIRVGNQPWSPESYWYNKDYPVQPRNIEKAKELIKQAGFEGKRIPIEIIHANATVTMQAMQVIQSMVAEAGFDVSLRATEFASLISEMSQGNYQLARLDWSGRIDPDANIHLFLTCKGGNNDTRYCNPQVDQLLDHARSVMEPEERKKDYDAAVAIIMDDAPMIYLGHNSWLYAYQKYINGFKAYPDGIIRLSGVEKQ